MRRRVLLGAASVGLAAFLRVEQAKWAGAVQTAKIKIE
jgi:hypothetical protein